MCTHTLTWLFFFFFFAHLVAQHPPLAGVPGKSFPGNLDLRRRQAPGADPGGSSARLWSPIQKDCRESLGFDDTSKGEHQKRSEGKGEFVCRGPVLAEPALVLISRLCHEKPLKDEQLKRLLL